MSTVSDYTLSNIGFSAFRAELNTILAAINTLNATTSAPASKVAGSLWLDTTSATTPTLKFYDGSDWISLCTFDYSANTVNWLDSTVSLGADSVDSDQYVDGSIDRVHLAADIIDGTKIDDNVIDSEHYVAASIDNEHIADDAVGLAEMASGTDGNIISYDASGNPVAIATGDDGQVLTSAGAGAPPAFETLAAGGGKILQHVTNSSLTGTATTNTSFTATSGLPTLDITPSATTSKILLFASFGEVKVNANKGYITIFKDSTDLGGGSSYGFQGTGSTTLTPAGGAVYTDSPNTTSQVTYGVRVRGDTSTTITIGGLKQTLTALELGA